jgi:hypothetical protein
MLKVNYYINQNLVTDSIINKDELSIELNFDKDDPAYRGQVSTNVWELGLGGDGNQDSAKNALAYINRGLIGGTGVFEGISFKITLEDGNAPVQTLFDGFLDLSKASITCSTISASAVETGDVDWLNNNADSFTFEYLYENDDVTNGKITRDDFVNIPYLISDIPDYLSATVAGISLFTIVTEFLDQVQTIIEKPVELPPFNLGFILTIILRIISLTILVISMIVLIIQLISTLVQFTKFHAGMYLFTLCERGSQYLGFDEFRSQSILETDDWSKVALLPEKYQQFPNKKDGLDGKIRQFSNSIIGYLTATDVDGRGYYRGTYGDYLRALKDMFNAKVFITEENGRRILRLEKLDFISEAPKYKLPPIDLSDVPYRFNSEDFISKLSVSFVSDINDKQSVNAWRGTETQVITDYKLVNNKFNLIKGVSKSVNIPFSRGKRNTKESFMERMFKEYVGFIKPIIFEQDAVLRFLKPALLYIVSRAKNALRALELLGINVPFDTNLTIPDVNLSDIASDLDDFIFRKRNALVMESDFVDTPKIIMMETSYDKFRTDDYVVKLSDRNEEVINSLNLYNCFHSFNTFVGGDYKCGEDVIKVEPNQYKIYSVSDIPFCIDDYNDVKDTNQIFFTDGITPAEIISLKWNPYKQTADIEFKIKQKYTDNLKEIIIESDGR